SSRSSHHYSRPKGALYSEIRMIGRGNYGTAHLVNDVETGAKLVVKKIPLVNMNEKERSDAWSESNLLRRISHPNIVQYVDTFLEDDVLHIVTQYCDGGDLSRKIKDAKTSTPPMYFDEDQVLLWFIQIAMAVDYLHSIH